MNFHKYFQFFYLIIALLFLYNAYVHFSKNEPFWVDLAFVAAAVFMFFFKRKFAKKYDDSQKK